MKRYYVFATLAFAGLSACTHNHPHFGKRDHYSKMAEVRSIAEDAKKQSAQALEEATRARKAAEKAATRADSIFKESQKK